MSLCRESRSSAASATWNTTNCRATTPRRAAAGMGCLVYQHDGRQGLEVWVLDTNAREPVASLWTKGAAAEISPDGDEARPGRAERADFRDARRWASHRPRQSVQVTFGVDSPSHLAWTTDGSRIAFQTPTGVGSVAADVPAGATSNEVDGTQRDLRGAELPARRRWTRCSSIDTTDLVAATVDISTATLARPARTRTTGMPGDAAGSHGASGLGDAERAGPLLPVRGRTASGPVLATSGRGLDAARARRTSPGARVDTRPACPQDARPTVTILGDQDGVSAQAEQDIRALGYQDQPGRFRRADRSGSRCAPAEYTDRAAGRRPLRPARRRARRRRPRGYSVFFSDGGRLTPVRLRRSSTGCGPDADVPHARARRPARPWRRRLAE